MLVQRHGSTLGFDQVIMINVNVHDIYSYHDHVMRMHDSIMIMIT